MSPSPVASVDRVVARAALEGVLAAAALDDVVAGAAVTLPLPGRPGSPWPVPPLTLSLPASAA